MISGIYKIENLINHHVYIGLSKDILNRWRSHKSNYNNPNCKDYNMVIYKAMRKYGIKNFSFEIIEKCSEELLNQREQYWIAYYNSYHNGYNSTLGGDEHHIHLSKPVELYDLKGNYITTYPSITEAAQAIGASRSTIYGILQGYRLSTKNYQFKLVGDRKEIKPYTNRQGGKKAVLQKDDDNNIINQFESVNEAARQLDLDSSSISKCCRGKLKHVGGFRWEYANEQIQRNNTE